MSERILICGLNWLGDGIMSMPAVQQLRRRRPHAGIDMLVKPAMAPLWRLHAVPDEVLVLETGTPGTFRAARRLAASGYDRAYVLPNSLRAALLPYLARVPERFGAGGHYRAWMLTGVAGPAQSTPNTRHQAREYQAILGFPAADIDAALEAPRLELSAGMADDLRGRLELAQGERWIGMIPGAAYGPSKRWPVENFIAAGRALAGDESLRILVFGTRAEQDLCARLAAGIGDRATDLGGRTSLAGSAALLRECAAVICNDSGGMHLAAAAGSRVVAVFGITDPGVTGPLGAGHRVLVAEGYQRARDLERDSPRAREALAAVLPERVVNETRNLIAEQWA